VKEGAQYVDLGAKEPSGNLDSLSVSLSPVRNAGNVGFSNSSVVGQSENRPLSVRESRVDFKTGGCHVLLLPATSCGRVLMFKKPLTAWTHQIRQAGLLLTACACGVLPARQSAAQYPNPIYRPVQAGPMNAVPAAPQQPPAVPTAERIRELASWYPLCIIVGENPASQFVSTETVDEGPFQDYIMGARVQGTQKTNSRTSIDFVSNGNALRMQFVLKGITVSNTLAQTSQASIQSAGSVDFQVSKQIEFDGQLIKTWSPAAFMTIRQQNLGASTAMSQIPLLGPLANNIVMSAAEQRKPMSEMIAAQRITQAVAPVFNSRLDGELTRLNSQLSGDLRQKLTTANLYPSHIATVSSDEAGLYGAAFETSIPQASQPGAFHPISNSQRRLRARPVRQLLPAPELPGRAGQTGINAPVPFALEAASIRDRIICLMHESLIGDVALRFNLPGREVPLETLQRFLGKPANADSDLWWGRKFLPRR